MNITPSTIYWLTRLDYICGFFIAATIILPLVLLFLLFIAFVAKMECEDDSFQKCSQFTRKCSVALLIAIAGAILTPNTKEVAAMIVIPKIANSETVQGLGKGIVELAHEWIRELKPNAEREGK